MNGEFAWTEPRVEMLKRGWADGLSASEIARNLLGNQSMLPIAEREHLTRSAVCGKLNRLGLQRGPRQPKQARIRPPRVRRRAPFAPAPVPAIAPAPPPAAALDSSLHCDDLVKLTNEMCRFPMWEDGGPHVYCGNPGADLHGGVPYCPIHMRIAYRRPGAHE